MRRNVLSAATCGLCLVFVPAVVGAGLATRHDPLRSFAAVRFRVPPGAVVTVDGRPTTATVFLNRRMAHSIRVTRNGTVLLAHDAYTPPPEGDVFDLCPPVPLAPAPRLVRTRETP